MQTVFIDGSSGEGGGQVLRTSLTLACVTGRQVHVENIRAARRKSGLAKQHLSCVKAACQICGGRCTGAELNSKVLDFHPGPVQGGDYHFDIGSAGSASLVIQTVLPALFLADEPSSVTVTGGTHNPLAPPFDFLDESFLPAIAQADFGAFCRLNKYGFFPAGGGSIRFDIRPRRKGSNSMINICEPDDNLRIHAKIYTAKLSEHIAQRQKKLLSKCPLDIESVEHIEVADSNGPGNCIVLQLCGSRRTTVFTAFGKKGLPSEKVVDELVGMAENFLSAGAAVDGFLADQLLIYMAMTKGGSFTTGEPTGHLLTNIETIKKFLPVDFTVDKAPHNGQKHFYKVTCFPD